MNQPNFMSVAQRVVDFFAVLASFAIGHWYYTAEGGSVPYSLRAFLALGAATASLYLMIFQSASLYHREMSLLNVVETRKLISSWFWGALLLVVASFYSRALDLSRLMITTSLVVSLVLLLVERAFFYRIQLAVNLKVRGRRVMIYGAGGVGRHLLKRIYHSPGLGITVTGFLDDDTGLWGKEVFVREIHRERGHKVYGGVDQLERLKADGVEEIFVALPRATYERTMEIVHRCEDLGLAVSVVPPSYGRSIYSVSMEEIGGIPVMREKLTQQGFIYPTFKRVFDFTVSVLALVVLSPVIAIIALCVRLDSPGPIFFRQKRVGINGKEFDFYKFRTMYVDANPYAFTPTESIDPRITKFGRWLRRSSLDELPQFFNVIKGDMSVVGPRPEMPFIVQAYSDTQRKRLLAKPGITGIWQISAVRGEPIHANLEYDLFYIEHQSLLLDVIILLKTFVCAIRGIGAV